MRIKLRENTTIDPTKKEEYLKLLTNMTQNKVSIYDRGFMDNLKSLITNSNAGVLSYEEQIMFLLYSVGVFVGVMFEFKNKSNDVIDDSEIKNLDFIKKPSKIIVVQIKDKNALFIELIDTSNKPLGTGMNAALPKKATAPIEVLPANVLPPSVNLNEPNTAPPSPPFSLNQPKALICMM